MRIRIFLVLILAAGLSRCKLHKNISSKNEQNNIILKEVTVTAPGEKYAYQPSAQRVNDIVHTILDVKFNYINQTVIGKATLTAHPYNKPVSQIDLDAKHFTLKQVAMITGSDTTDLRYTYDTAAIHINLGRIYHKTDTFIIFIDYTARPGDIKQKGSAAISDTKGLYFINPMKSDHEKPREIWTQGETQSNSGWFPTNDVPNEKMTTDIYITADSGDVTLSNGELIYSKINNDGTHTDYWKQSLPHATYLVMMAVGEFDIVKDTWRDSVEVNYYVEHDYKPYAKLIFGHTPEMIDFFSRTLKVDFPWYKFSQVVVRDFVSGAMENTSAVVHFEGLNHDANEHLDNSYESIISHELFHQWFGDLVTCESWSNVPLNESFATYGQYLWDEYKYGSVEADHNFEENRDNYFLQRSKFKTQLIRFKYHNREDMFDVVSYQKGACVLNMLRRYVGDDAFFESLHLYLTRNAFKTVEIHDLRLAFEEVTGEDLNWFFNQWFLGAGHPELRFSYNYDMEHRNVTVQIEQIQDSSAALFRMPTQIELYSNGKITTRDIIIQHASDTFSFHSDSAIDLVNIDPGNIILAQKIDLKPMDEYDYQFIHASLYADKLKAYKGIVANMSDTLNVGLRSVIEYSLTNTFFGVNELGIDLIGRLRSDIKMKYATRLREFLHYGERASLRLKAAECMHDADPGSFQNDFLKSALDSSYQVAGTSLRFIAESDPDLAIKIGNKYRASKSGKMQSSYAYLIGKFGKGDQIEYFESTFGKFGFYKFSILGSYSEYLGRSDTSIVIKAIPGLRNYYRKSIASKDFYSKMMVQKIVSDLYRPYQAIVDMDKKTESKNGENSNVVQTHHEEEIRSESMLFGLSRILLPE